MSSDADGKSLRGPTGSVGETLAPALFRRLVWKELLRRGLIPAEEAYVSTRAQVTRWGGAEWAKIRLLVGEDQWDRANQLLSRPYHPDEPERMLGFGSLLTRFVIAPLALPKRIEEQVAGSGALANLIVAVYDQFLDCGVPVSDLLHPGILDPSRHSHPGPRPRLPDARHAAPTAVLTRLVDAYFGRVERLPYARRHTSVRALLNSSIASMYEAENDLAGGTTGTPLSVLLRRKASLPMVVLGLPAWLAVPDVRPEMCAWHLRWMYRLGMFVGLVDDTVDLVDDLAHGEPNLVSLALEVDGRDAEVLATEIASRGARCVREWRAHASGDRGIDPLTADALGATVYSWFGASRIQ